MDSNVILIVAIALFVAGVVFLYLLFGRSGRPRDAVEWTGAVLSALLVVASVFLITVTLEMDPAAPGAPVDAQGYPTLAASEMNAPAPNFAFRLVDDERTVDLASYRGQVVLINFWATWCAPCLTELPDLNELQRRYAGQGLVVLTISDEERDELRAFEETMPLETVAGYVDQAALPEPYSRTIQIRPTSYVIDRDGVVREYILGARDLASFEQLVVPYLDRTTASG